MDHLNPKTTDISLKSVKYLVVIILLYISGCDFRMPQKWETPKWILPLTIPMLDDTLTVVDMIDSESSSIELMENSNYSVSVDTIMIPEPPEEGSISIDENYFSRYYNFIRRKPSSLMLKSAIKDYQVDPNETIMVGDKVSDMTAGINAGIKKLYYIKSSVYDEDVKKIRNVHYVNSLLECTNYILNDYSKDFQRME